MSVRKDERENIVKELIQEIAISEEDFSVASFAAQHNLTKQSIYRYIHTLVAEGKLVVEKKGRKNTFSFVDEKHSLRYALKNLSEDVVWSKGVRPFLVDLPEIAYSNLVYAFTEILNNAIDHSDGTSVLITIIKNIYQTTIIIADNGIGIFTKIANAMGLEEKSFAILELAKGKFTTEPDSHTGEGVFFSSKVVDNFAILSDNLIFLGPTSSAPPLIDTAGLNSSGTVVVLTINNYHEETSKEVFDRFTEAPESYGFTKTLVPVRLLEYGDDKPLVVSRSQAKRLMVRFERFENIILDFSGIDEIGQGFADELFRVFPSQHPNTILTPINYNEQIINMINRVTTTS